MIFILLAALVLLGPEKLPEAMRKVGRIYSEVRKISSGFQSELRNALDEPTKDLRDAFEQPAKELRNTAEQAKSAFSLQQLKQPTPSTPTRRVADPRSTTAPAAEPVSDAFGALPTHSGPDPEPDAETGVPPAGADEGPA